MFGASVAFGTGPKFIISACKNQSPFHFVATLFHDPQLSSVRIQLGFDAPAHPCGGLGLAWLLFCLFCFANAWRNSFDLRSSPLLASHPNPLVRAAKIWLYCCLLAAVLRIIPQALWHDDWGRRHAEARLLILAVALYLGLKFSQPVSYKSLQIWMGACWVACASGFGTTLWLGKVCKSRF